MGLEIDPKITGAFILQLRKEYPLTQKQLAEKLGITDKAISRWETGKGYPDIEMLVSIGELFSVSVNELLCGERIKTPVAIASAEKAVAGAYIDNTVKKHRSNVVAGLLGAVILMGMVLLAVSIPFINNACAAANHVRLTALPLPEDTVCVEVISYTGHLVGNGNGMQFFAAMLVESTQSLQDLQSHYTPLDCIVQEQAGRIVERIDGNSVNIKLLLQRSLDAEKTYYLVYSWGDGIPPFSWLDIRGS